MEALKISMSGLDVEWMRTQVIAHNLANMNTVQSADNPQFQPLRLVSGPQINFSSLLTQTGEAPAPSGVQIVELEPVSNGLVQKFEPDHPLANAEGFVSYTNIDHASEMTMMIKASRAYESNLTAFSIAQQMYSRALELGRQS